MTEVQQVPSPAAPGSTRVHRVAVIAGGGLLLLAAAVGTLLGLPVWALVLLAAAPWAWIIGTRWGTTPAVVTTVLGGFWVILASTMVTGSTSLPLLPTFVVLLTGIGAGGVWLTARSLPVLIRRPSLVTVAIWVPSLLGTIVWGATMLATAFVPGAARVSWVMNGDTANNLLYAREAIERGGIELGAMANPVPLPSAIMTIAMAPGRAAIPASDFLAHDITALAQAWGLIIAVSCVLAGAVAATLTSSLSSRPWVTACIGAGASLLPLTWFATGVNLEFGFFNAQIALPIVLGSILIAFGARSHPVAVLSVEFIATTLLLSVWSPLAVLPISLGALVIIRERTGLLRRGKVSTLALALSLLQLVIYGIVLVLPSLLAQGGALAALGGIFPYRKFMLPLLVVPLLVLVFVAARKLRNVVVIDVLVISLGFSLVLAVLAFISGNPFGQWSYYPQKFSWMASIVVLVLLVGAGGAVVARYLRPVLVAIIGLSLLAGGVLGFLTASAVRARLFQQGSAAEILTPASFARH